MECLNKPGVAKTRWLSNTILLEIHKIKSGFEYINSYFYMTQMDVVQKNLGS
jgi:hypothetical protein